MLSGRYDYSDVPLETAQRPLFALLSVEQKKLEIFEAGHFLRIEDMAAAILPWLDRYLGPVVR